MASALPPGFRSALTRVQLFLSRQSKHLPSEPVFSPPLIPYKYLWPRLGSAEFQVAAADFRGRDPADQWRWRNRFGLPSPATFCCGDGSAWPFPSHACALGRVTGKAALLSGSRRPTSADCARWRRWPCSSPTSSPIDGTCAGRVNRFFVPLPIPPRPAQPAETCSLS
jgi:hypothetical protein